MMAEGKQHATAIVRMLHASGYEAYFAGGCVRDLLLGREPSDYDVATDATPKQVMRLFPETYAVGEQFGVVLVPESGGATGEAAQSRRAVIEVATFRSDVGYTDGRHPDEVRFSRDAREDAQRRDFTINGMMLDPETGAILDFVGGREDLKAGTIRAIGDAARRFREDKLRMLRAVRFAARFEYRIEPATRLALREQVAGIQQVSCERIREELTRMLTEGKARRAFELLDETLLLPEVLPEIAAMKGVEQPPQFHPEGDVFLHTLLLLEKLAEDGSKTLAWGALLHDVGKPATFRMAPDRIRFDGHVDVGVTIAAAILRRLRFSNHETDQILALVENHMRFGDVQRMNQSTLKKFMRLRRFEEHLELHRMDALSSNGSLAAYEFARAAWETTPAEAMRPAPLITGRDLIEAGYAPGPRFTAILAAVENGQLEGRLTSRAAALEFVRRDFPGDEDSGPAGG
jgi:poly(A) polymerase